MIHRFVSFTPPLLFHEHWSSYSAEGKTPPYSPAEAERIRFGLPFAYLALAFDLLDADKKISNAGSKRETIMLLFLGSLHSREFIERRIGDLVVTPPELELARRGLGSRSQSVAFESQQASETAIGKLILTFRLNGHIAVLKKVRSSDRYFFRDPQMREFDRYEALAFSTNLCATGNPEAAENSSKIEFLVDIFAEIDPMIDKTVRALA